MKIFILLLSVSLLAKGLILFQDGCFKCSELLNLLGVVEIACMASKIIITTCFVFCVSRFSAAVSSRSGAAAGELVAGGADDRAHLEVHPLSWQTHLRTGPHPGQVARDTSLIFTLVSFLICYSNLFLFLSLSQTHLKGDTSAL